MNKKSFKSLTMAGLIAISALISPASTIYADTLNNSFYANNLIPWYDPDAQDVCTNGTSAAAISGDENAETAFNFFLAKGLSPQNAAGFLGNMHEETGGTFDPRQLEIRDNQRNIAEVNEKIVNGSRGFGLIQWTSANRQQALVDYAVDTDRNTTDLDLQLDFLWKEVNEDYPSLLDKLKEHRDDVVESAFWVHEIYERSIWTGNPERTRQVRGRELGMDYYERYKGNAPSATTTSTGGGCSNGSGIGDYMSDEFKIFNQCDGEWANKLTYTGYTFCQAGCGPASLAMVAYNMAGKSDIDPLDLHEIYEDQKLWASGAEGRGSSKSGIVKAAPQLGLKTEDLKDTSLDTARQVFEKGGMIILGGESGPAPWISDTKHYLVVRGITDDGKVRIADPGNHSSNGKDYTVEQIFGNGIANMSVAVYPS